MNKKINGIIAGLCFCGIASVNATDIVIKAISDKYVTEMNTTINSLENDSVLSFLGNDIMPEDYNAGLEMLSMPQNGTLEVDTQTGDFVYIPNENFTGTDACCYALIGENGITNRARVQFVVEEGSGAPGDIQIASGSHILVNEQASEIKKAYIQGKGKKYKLKVLEDKNGNSELFISKKCFRTKIKTKLNELKPDLSPKEAKLVLQKQDGSKEVIDVEFNIPKINQIKVENGKIIVAGRFFGLSPKIDLVDIETGKAIRMKINKKQLKYKNQKGKQSCMNPDTGDSEVTLTPKKELVQGLYKLIIKNNVGCGIDSETHEIPEIVVE